MRPRRQRRGVEALFRPHGLSVALSTCAYQVQRSRVGDPCGSIVDGARAPVARLRGCRGSGKRRRKPSARSPPAPLRCPEAFYGADCASARGGKANLRRDAWLKASRRVDMTWTIDEVVDPIQAESTALHCPRAIAA